MNDGLVFPPASDFLLLPFHFFKAEPRNRQIAVAENTLSGLEFHCEFFFRQHLQPEEPQWLSQQETPHQLQEARQE